MSPLPVYTREQLMKSKVASCSWQHLGKTHSLTLRGHQTTCLQACGLFPLGTSVLMQRAGAVRVQRCHPADHKILQFACQALCRQGTERLSD